MTRLWHQVLAILLGCSMTADILKDNISQSFLVEDLMIRTKTFQYINEAFKTDRPYLVVNFNQFRILHSVPDLPVVKVVGIIGEQSFDYFDTQNSGWLFDENLVVVPLLNFQQFSITIAWRESIFKTSFQGSVTVFPRQRLTLRPNMIVPVFIDANQTSADLQITHKIAANGFDRGVLHVDACMGSIDFIEIIPAGSKTGRKFEETEASKGLEFGPVKAGQSVGVRVVKKKDNEGLAVKISVVAFDEDKSVMATLIKHKPLISYDSNSAILWQNLQATATTHGFGLKTNFLVDSDKQNLVFKSICGFGRQILATDYPRQPESTNQQFMAVRSSGSDNFEFSFYTESKSDNEPQKMDLVAERKARFGAKHEEIIRGDYYVAMKEFYYAMSNYNEGTYFYVTVFSDPIKGKIESVEPYPLTFIKNHFVSVCLSALAFLILFLCCRLKLRSDPDSTLGRLRLPQSAPDSTFETSIEMTTDAGKKTV